MKRAIVLGLVWLLGVSAAMEAQSGLPERFAESTPTSEKVRERVAGLSRDSLVEVRLTDHSRVVGRLGAVTDKTFVVQVGQGSVGSQRQITFTAVKSLKLVGARKSHKKLVIVLIIVAGVVGAAVAFGMTHSSALSTR